jgi:hypothetical protein
MMVYTTIRSGGVALVVHSARNSIAVATVHARSVASTPARYHIRRIWYALPYDRMVVARSA